MWIDFGFVYIEIEGNNIFEFIFKILKELKKDLMGVILDLI